MERREHSAKMRLECQERLGQHERGRVTGSASGVLIFLMEYKTLGSSIRRCGIREFNKFPAGMPLAQSAVAVNFETGANPMRFTKWLGLPAILPLQYFFVAAISLLAGVNPLAAQEPQELTPPKLEAKALIGGANFGEDLPHGLVGGAIRFYVTKRLSIEPEYLYLRHSEDDQDQIFQPNVAYDFTDPRKRFVAYGIAGVGVLRHKGRFPGNDFVTGAPVLFDTSFTTWTASIGGGVKIFATKRFFISPEVRVGREPNFRATINVGYVFSGRN